MLGYYTYMVAFFCFFVLRVRARRANPPCSLSPPNTGRSVERGAVRAKQLLKLATATCGGEVQVVAPHRIRLQSTPP